MKKYIYKLSELVEVEANCEDDAWDLLNSGDYTRMEEFDEEYVGIKDE